ncbi:MAG TPA: beta-ketoacyl synthase N-terminal-like domain-containing protein [Dissulfurispiraceae bacterium]|nr:beta-ketoacyl synthase N-terminal-like domain-containing protein [Dissulfurispiraceae bacterium]
MSRLIITGTSMVSPIGIRREDVWRNIETGKTGLGRLSRFPFDKEVLCGEIRDFDLSDYISDGRFRRAATISQYALASIAMALDEASATGSSVNTAMVMGITHGALGYTQSFHRELIREGPEAVSPIHFSDSVLNAPAGNASICFGFNGPVHTVLGGPETIIKSIMTACRMVYSGQVDRAVVASAEELNELSLYCYTRLGYPAISEGAGAIVIERERSDTKKSKCCLVAGAASECNPSDPDAALSSSVSLCMNRAGVQVSEIDLVMTCMNDPRDCILKGVPTAGLSPFTGYAFATSMIWTIAFSVMAIRNGSAPQTVIRSGKISRTRVKNVIVCTDDRQGNAAALLLRNDD